MAGYQSQQLSGDVIRSESWPGLHCHDLIYKPGFRLTKHEHESAFLGLALGGTYRETTGATSYEYTAGTVVFHPAHEEHALQVGATSLRCFVVELDSREIEQRFECLLPQSAPRPDGNAAALLATMYSEFRVGDSSAALSLQGLLLQLIAVVSRKNERGQGRPFLDRVDEFLRANFRSQLTLGQIAEAVGAPADRLSSAFRASRGHSIADEQRRLRIEHACWRMLDRSASLAEIAIECGFADQPHFSRAFRRIKGMTPGQYRMMIR